MTFCGTKKICAWGTHTHPGIGENLTPLPPPFQGHQLRDSLRGFTLNGGGYHAQCSGFLVLCNGAKG